MFVNFADAGCFAFRNAALLPPLLCSSVPVCCTEHSLLIGYNWFDVYVVSTDGGGSYIIIYFRNNWQKDEQLSRQSAKPLT